MKRLMIVCLHMFVVVSLTFISSGPVHASTILSTFHDDFDRQDLGTDFFYGTNSSDSYHLIDNGILTINSGSQDGGGRWISSNQTYSYFPGSHGLIFETRARIDPGERHFSVGLIGDNHDGAFLISDLHATGHLWSVVNATAQTAPTQLIDQVDISEWHVYRFEVACSTVKFYVDDILRTVHDDVDVIPANKPLRMIFDKGSQGTPSTLYTDYVDLKVVEENCPRQQVFYEPFDDLDLTNNPAWEISIPQSPGDAFTGELITHGAHVDGSDRYLSEYNVRNLSIDAPDYLEISYDGRLIPFSQGALYQDGRGIILGLVGPQGRYDLNIQNGYTSGFSTDQNAFSIVYHSPGNFPRNLISSNSIGYPRPVDGINYHVRAVRQNGVWSLYVDGNQIGSIPEPFALTQITHVHLPVVGSVAIDNIQIITGWPTEILDANINIYNIINGPGDGSSLDTFYGFEAFVRVQGDFSTFNASKVTLTVDGIPLNIEHAGISYDGGEYSINASGTFEGIPPLGEYAIRVEDANGQVSESFIIGSLEDYPRDAAAILFPQHLNSSTETQPTFSWEAFSSSYLGQPVAPWAYEINLVFPSGEKYFVFPIDSDQTTLDYENPAWDPNQPPELEPGLYGLAIHSNHHISHGFNFEHHRMIHFEIVSPNQPPTVNAGESYSIHEGGSVDVTASGNDPEGGSLAYAWDLDNNGTFETPGQSVTFSAVGLEAGSSHTITVQATDHGGLSATDQTVVNVIYDFHGFFQPIDNLPTLNIINAGKSMPVKFSLNGYQGMNIIVAGYPASNIISCSATAGDAVEQTLTAGSSSLSYDANTDQYIYIWKTDKAWAGTCRTLVIKLSDGTYHRASFKFK